MEKTFENDNFRTNRNNGRSIPPLVVSRAKSAGPVGETWLAKLDGMISELEHIWNISVGEALSGGDARLCRLCRRAERRTICSEDGYA